VKRTFLPLITLFFFSALFNSACTKSDESDLASVDRSNANPPESALVDFPEPELLDINIDTIRYLALGDSYTIGESVSPSGRWPVQLAEALSVRPETHVPTPTIIAQTGWTTSNLSSAMDSESVDDEEFDLVSLLIGVNNQYQGLSIDEYAIEFEELLERAIAIAPDSSKVFVVSIPDYGYTPFGASNQENISSELAEFNQVCRDITIAHGVRHYNITDISQQWPDVPGLVASDGLHPSALQYGLWVDSFEAEVFEQLR
jgi:lysophospholipase L1-like esterase